MTRAPHSPGRGQNGFTMIELMVVVALAAMLVVALQQGLIGQRHFYEVQRATSDRNEAIRFATVVLGGAFREASVVGQDVAILATDRVRVRVPHGFGVLCGSDGGGRRLGVVLAQGRWEAEAGDSVLIRRSTGWSADAIARIDAASNRVACSLSGGLIIRPDGRDPDVVEGAPTRSFRSQVFETGMDAGSRWLYRIDGVQREILLGPLDGVDGFRVWYVDASGAEVPSGASADRVVVRVIARSQDMRGQPVNRRDTLLMTFGGRNR